MKKIASFRVGRFAAASVTHFILVGLVTAGFALIALSGGPTGLQAPESVKAAPAPMAVRTLRAVAGNACNGTVGTVSVELESEGNETALSFTLNFDQTKLSNPVVNLGSGVPAGTTLTVNNLQAASGRIGVLVDSNNSFALSPPNRQVVTIQFNVAAGAPTGPTTLSFGGTPTPLSTSDATGNLLPTAYVNGSLNISCVTAAMVSVSGRVMSPSGTALRGATVTLTDAAGNRRSVLTSSLGYYDIDGIEAGNTYMVSVTSRKYRFQSRIVQLLDNVTDFDFTGIE